MTTIPYDLSGASYSRSGWHTWQDDDGEPKPLRPRSYVEQTLAAAQTVERRRALRRERGIALPSDVGWDADRQAWFFLIRDGSGIPVNHEWRPVRGRTMRWYGEDVAHPVRVGGRKVENGCLPLYPRVPQGDTWLLVAGTWDVHAARQAGLAEALTGLSGCLWHPAWNDHALGKSIAVAYDQGEQDAAVTTVKRLHQAGCEAAWVVDLGLPEPGADIEQALRPKKYGGYGWTGERLRAVCGLESA